MTDLQKGIEQERERVRALTEMRRAETFSAGAVQEVIDEAIERGASPDETLGLVLATLRTNNTARAELDNAPAIDTGGGATASGARADRGLRGEEFPADEIDEV